MKSSVVGNIIAFRQTKLTQAEFDSPPEKMLFLHNALAHFPRKLCGGRNPYIYLEVTVLLVVVESYYKCCIFSYHLCTKVLLLQNCLKHFKFRTSVFSTAFATLSFKFPIAIKQPLAHRSNFCSLGHLTSDMKTDIFKSVLQNLSLFFFFCFKEVI